MKPHAGILIILLFTIMRLNAQITPTPPPSGFASDNTDVQVTTSSLPHAEESISIDKTNPKSLLVSANNDELICGSNSVQGYYYSLDGGKTWAGSDSLPQNAQGFCDPVTSFDASGQAYLISLGGLLQGYGDGVEAQTSANNGLSWNPQVYITGGPTSSEDGIDKPHAGTIDVQSTSPYVNYFYTTWTNFDLDNNGTDIIGIQFNRSTDGGLTFSDPLTLSSGTTSTGTNVQTGPNGEVYVCWIANVESTPSSVAFAADVSNGGTSFTSSTAFSETGIFNNTNTAAFGETRINNFPSMAVDKSCGAHRGRIYIAYTDGYYTNSINLVKVSYSDNHGSTWSSPATLSSSGFSQSWFPWIAVDDLTGLVNVAYFAIDGSNYTTDTYVSYSTDGGGTWQTLKTSDVSHISAPIPNVAGGCADFQFAPGYCGDYIGLCSYGGHSYACWHDNHSGNWQVYVSRIDYNLPLLYSSETNLDVNAPSSLTGNITYQATDNIYSTSNNSDITIASGANVTYKAGINIILNPGFTASSNSNFLAVPSTIAGCQTPGELSLAHLPNLNSGNRNSDAPLGSAYCYPNPTNGKITFALNNRAIEGDVVLQIKNMTGQIIENVSVEKQLNGLYLVEYNTAQLSAGIYFYSFISGKQSLTDKFVKMN